MPIPFVLIGEIGAPQGVRGELRVVPHTDYPDRFLTMEEILLFLPKEEVLYKTYPLESARFHKQFVILKLKGIDTRDLAQELRGYRIQVAREDVVPLPEGRHYVFDLIGLMVVSTCGLVLGNIVEVLKTGANDVYVVEKEKKQVLIPVIPSVVKDISLETKTVRIELMDGLLD